MRVIATSILVAVLLAVGAGLVLSAAQKPTYQARAMPTARVGDPGENLVGRDWSGLHKAAHKGIDTTQTQAERD